jgi:PASTA domain
MKELRRATLVAVTALSALVAIPPAIAGADTIAISPTQGPVGTTISFDGNAACPDQVAEDAEVFVQVGNFAGNSNINPRTKVETDATGAFSGTFAAPDPFASADPRAPREGVRTYPVSVRCIDESGEHSDGETVIYPPTFTYTDPQCVVPKLKGKKAAAAKMALKKAGCALGKVKRKKASPAKRRRVLGQSPAPHTHLPLGSTVRVTVGK